MATFTIAANANIDSLVGRTGSDTYNINTAALTIDEHSRFGLNANTSATLGAVTTSATLGGDLIVDGRYVRLIAYDTGSGNVPAYNTTVSQGSASGLLIGVYDDLASAPTAPGAAMPADGFILIKQWNSVAYTAGALTGIGANATAADRVGWIEIVGNEQNTAAGICTFNGLGNQTTPQFRGAKYEIGTTPGTPARTDTYQIPTNGNTCYMPGVWVEKSAGSEDYEFYATTSDTALVANVATDIRRGKYCWVDSATGTLRFGHDGTNSTGGYVPPAGCKIVTGNIFLTMAPNATPTVNSLNATQATRYRISGTSLPKLTMDWVTCNWYLGMSTPGLVTVTNTSFVGPMSFSQNGEKMVWTKVGVGSPVASTSAGMVELVQLGYGVDFTDVYISYGNFGASARNVLRSNLSRNLTLLRCELGFTGSRPATTNYAFTILSGPSIDIQDCIFGGCINHTSGANVNITGANEFWFDHADVVGTSTMATYCLTFSTSSDVLVDGITFPISGQLPRNGIVTFSNGLRNTIRNIGTYSAPIDFRLYEEVDAAWSRVTTTATVTTAAPHGLSTGHRAVVTVSDSTAAITVNLKDITVTGANTFTFTCLNAGATSGVLSFYGACSSSAVMIDVNSTNTELTKIQNVHVKGNTGAIWSIHATSIDTLFQNVSWDQEYGFHATIAGTNTICNSLSLGAIGASTTATLGTHWEDVFVQEEGVTEGVGVAWTRSSGTVTVTSNDHGLATGNYIQTYDSSAPTGATQNHLTSITVTNKDTFTYTGAASGAASGTISYRVPEGIIKVLCNAPSATTTSQAVVTSGTPAFTGIAQLVMFNVGDQIYFETPDWILGHDGFTVGWPNTGASGGSPRNNVDIEYQIDRGSGWSAWKNMHVKRTSGAGTSAASTITVNDTTGIAVDDYVWNASTVAGVGPEAKVVSVDSATDLTLDVANVATFSGATLYFGQHPNEAAFPSTGIKLRIRLTTITAFTNAITSIDIMTKTTAASRLRLYPQDVDTVSFTLSGLPTGTTVALYDNTDTELQREDNILTGSFVYEYIHSGVDFEDNYYVIWHEDYVPYKSDLFDLTATDLGLSYTPVDDPIYDPAHDDRYTVDFPNKLIIMDTGETSYDVPGAYSQWKDDIFLADNFTYDFAFTIKGGIDYATPKAIPPFTALINSWKIRPDEDDHTLTVENGILYVEGGGDPFVDTLGAYTVRINYSQPVEVLLVSTGSGVLPTDITDIAEAVWQNTDVNTGTQKGKILKDAADNAELGFLK